MDWRVNADSKQYHDWLSQLELEYQEWLLTTSLLTETPSPINVLPSTHDPLSSGCIQEKVTTSFTSVVTLPSLNSVVPLATETCASLIYPSPIYDDDTLQLADHFCTRTARELADGTLSSLNQLFPADTAHIMSEPHIFTPHPSFSHRDVFKLGPNATRQRTAPTDMSEDPVAKRPCYRSVSASQVPIN